MANFKVSLIIQTLASLAGLKASTKAVADLTKVTSSAVAPAKALGSAIDHTKQQTPPATKAVKDLATAEKAAASAADALGNAQDRTGKRVVSFAARMRLARIRTTEWRGELGRGVRSLSTFTAQGIGSLIGGATLAVGWLTVASLSQARLAKEVRQGAQANGLSTTSYQRLGYAFDTVVGPGLRVSDVLKNLNGNIIKAARGGKDQKVAFQALGISYMKTARQVQPADVLLGKVADKFAKMPDGAKKAAIASMLFGDAGAALIPVLNKGSAGLKDLGDEAERFGLVLSDDAIKKAAGLELQWMRTIRMAKGLRDALVTALLPSFASLVGWTEQILARDRQKILGNITAGAKQLVANMPKILKGLGDLWTVLSVIAGIGATVVRRLGGLNGVLDVLGGILAARLAFGLIQVTALIWGVNGALWAFPGTWIIAAIAAVAYGAILLIKYWKPITAFFGDLFGRLMGWFKGLPLWAQVLVSLPLTIIAHWKQITGFFTNVFATLKTVFVDGVARIWDSLPPWFRTALKIGAIAVNPGLGLGAMALSAARPSGPAAPNAAVGARSNQLSGTIRIAVDQDGRARVAQAETNAPGVDFDMMRGFAMPGG